MRIDAIRLVNFGSHAEKTWLPGDARLSVIVGPNGAGKTTLLIEGPQFALFGDVPGGHSADQLVRTGATDLSATVEFELDGLRYRAIRRRTTRAGGKTSADLQVQRPDGSWFPLASGSDAVTAEAGRLLRMDKHTFRTTVMLAQGDAKRFMDATSGKGTPTAPGRAAILSTIVVDPRFAMAAVRANEEARDLEAKSSAERGQLERLRDAIDELEPIVAIREQRAAEVEHWTTEQTTASDRRDIVEVRLRELAVEIAAADAAPGEVARLEAERDGLAERYRAARARATDADAAAAAARSLLADAPAVQRAVDELPAQRLALEVLLATQAEDGRLGLEWQTKRDEVELAVGAHADRVRTWEAEAAPLRGRIATLEDEGRHATKVECPKCRTIFAAGEGRILAALTESRTALKALGDPPKEPLAIARERAALTRIVQRRTEVAFDPQELVRLHAEIAVLERTAARAEAIAGAWAALERASAAKVEAAAEVGTITAAGEGIAARLAAARTLLEGVQPLVVEQGVLRDELDQLAAAAAAIEASRREAERRLATAEAQLERRAELQAEHQTISAGLVVADVDLGRLRRLAIAFGVKGIPARIVERVLPELGRYANEMLGQLRPGMTLELRAQRAKADGKGTVEALDIWIRDHRGERQRWSGGEGTSIAMSIAVALNRLAARRAGARVATLVIDEPDGLDSAARRAFGQALLALAHRGDLERVAVITHQDGIPDFADEVVELEPDLDGRPAVVTEAA